MRRSVRSTINRGDQVSIRAATAYRATPMKSHCNLTVLVSPATWPVRVLQEKVDGTNTLGQSSEGGVQVVDNLLPQRPVNSCPFQLDVQLHSKSSSLSFEPVSMTETEPTLLEIIS